MQNVSPAHTPDIVVFLDAITIVFEEASKEGSPCSLPMACIEAGNDHSLPNLPLRLLSTLVSLIYVIQLFNADYQPGNLNINRCHYIFIQT